MDSWISAISMVATVAIGLCGIGIRVVKSIGEALPYIAVGSIIGFTLVLSSVSAEADVCDPKIRANPSPDTATVVNIGSMFSHVLDKDGKSLSGVGIRLEPGYCIQDLELRFINAKFYGKTVTLKTSDKIRISHNEIEVPEGGRVFGVRVGAVGIGTPSPNGSVRGWYLGGNIVFQIKPTDEEPGINIEFPHLKQEISDKPPVQPVQPIEQPARADVEEDDASPHAIQPPPREQAQSEGVGGAGGGIDSFPSIQSNEGSTTTFDPIIRLSTDGVLWVNYYLPENGVTLDLKSQYGSTIVPSKVTISGYGEANGKQITACGDTGGWTDHLLWSNDEEGWSGGPRSIAVIEKTNERCLERYESNSKSTWHLAEIGSLIHSPTMESDDEPGKALSSTLVIDRSEGGSPTFFMLSCEYGDRYDDGSFKRIRGGVQVRLPVNRSEDRFTWWDIFDRTTAWIGKNFNPADRGTEGIENIVAGGLQPLSCLLVSDAPFSAYISSVLIKHDNRSLTYSAKAAGGSLQPESEAGGGVDGW